MSSFPFFALFIISYMALITDYFENLPGMDGYES